MSVWRREREKEKVAFLQNALVMVTSYKLYIELSACIRINKKVTLHTTTVMIIIMGYVDAGQKLIISFLLFLSLSLSLFPIYIYYRYA
jgi:hypothetical protein